jgi:hypothetical protein
VRRGKSEKIHPLLWLEYIAKRAWSWVKSVHRHCGFRVCCSGVRPAHIVWPTRLADRMLWEMETSQTPHSLSPHEIIWPVPNGNSVRNTANCPFLPARLNWLAPTVLNHEERTAYHGCCRSSSFRQNLNLVTLWSAKKQRGVEGCYGGGWEVSFM